MIDTMLIIITGISGSGKSTTAQYLAWQYQRNNIRHQWLHEEKTDHPIRAGEFSIGSLYSERDLERNIQDMFCRWERLVSQILRSEFIHILEGVLYENILCYFYDSRCPLEKMIWYYDELMKRMSPVRPVVVHLYWSNVRATLEAMYQVRGLWWQNLILDDEQNQYFRDHGLTGEDGVYTMWQSYQDTAAMMFRRWQGHKIRIDTTGGAWESYIARLAQFIGLEYQPPEIITIQDPEKYCGRYEIKVGDRLNTLDIKFDGTNLYCQSFWSYMKLLPLGSDRFVFSSFPIELTFLDNEANEGKSVRVRGSYDWEIMGKTLPMIVP